MKTVNLLHLYELPEKRKDEPKKLDERLMLSSIETSYHNQYISIGMEGAQDLFVVIGPQVTKATKNAANTVRGAMAVQSSVDTFTVAPTSYDQSQWMTKRDGQQVLIDSTSLQGFVAIVLPGRTQPCIVKTDEVLAAVENVTRT